MAKTDIAGYGGGFTAPSGMNLNAHEWSGTLEVNPINVPAAFGELWDGADLGTARFTGTVRGKGAFDTTNTKPFPLPPTTTTSGWSIGPYKATATLTAATGCTITGTFIFHTLSISRSNNGYMEVTASFRNSAQDIGVTWDES